MESEHETFDVGGDLTVNRLGFGAMSLAGSHNMGWTDDIDGAKRVVERAIDLGANFVDTADMYGNGSSELVVGETIDASRDDVVVATKGGILKQPDGDTVLNGTPTYLKNAALKSRVRLRVDEIDLYQYHRPDPDTPFEESVQALAELKDAGVIRHAGLSNVTVDQLETARDIVDIATVQNEYNVTNREHEDVLEYCESNDIGFIPYSPIGETDLGEKQAVVDEIATAHDASPYQVALAWVYHRSPVTLPIPGTADMSHLEENMGAAKLDLSSEELDRLT